MYVKGSERNEQSQQRTFYRCFLTRFSTFGQTVSEEKNLKNQPIRNKNRMWRQCLLNGSGQNEQSIQRTFHRCFLQSFGSFGQAVSEEKIFRNRPIRNKNCLLRPCLLIDRDEKNNLYTGPPIDQSYNVQVHLAEQFQRRRILKIGQSETRIACGGHVCYGSERNKQSQQRTFRRCFLPRFGPFGQTVSEEQNFLNQPIRSKNRLWRSCLLLDRDGISNLDRGPSIDASYQVSVHLAKRFQRSRIFKISQSETRVAYGGHVC